MTELPRISGGLLGSTPDDLTGTVWLLGHDLKSPVATIISTMEMLISLYEDDPQQKTLVHMLRAALAAANRQYNMVSDMLDLARFELQQYDLELKPLDIGSMVRDGIEAERYSLETKKLNLELQIPAEPLMILADEDIFRRVVSALIDNVMKFTVKDDLFRVSLSSIGDHIVLQVTDTGRPFSQVLEASISARAPHWSQRQAGSRTSVGMGLPFISYAAQVHGGKFAVHSDPQTGQTTLTLTLPVLKDVPGMQ